MRATTTQLSGEHTRAKETQRFQSRGDTRLNIHRRHSAGRTSKRPPVRVYVRTTSHRIQLRISNDRLLFSTRAARTNVPSVTVFILSCHNVYFFFFRSTQRTRACAHQITDRPSWIPIPPLSRFQNPLLVEART